MQGLRQAFYRGLLHQFQEMIDLFSWGTYYPEISSFSFPLDMGKASWVMLLILLVIWEWDYFSMKRSERRNIEKMLQITLFWRHCPLGEHISCRLRRSFPIVESWVRLLSSACVPDRMLTGSHFSCLSHLSCLSGPGLQLTANVLCRWDQNCFKFWIFKDL